MGAKGDYVTEDEERVSREREGERVAREEKKKVTKPRQSVPANNSRKSEVQLRGLSKPTVQFGVVETAGELHIDIRDCGI